MEGAFQPGETVRLKSGGPKMTVDVQEHETVFCFWMNGNDQKSGTFPASVLERVPRGIPVRRLVR